MNIGVHHHLEHKNKKLVSFIDRCIYALGGFGVVVVIPQLVQIWIHHNVQGVSLVTWLGFAVGTLFWLAYGILHQERPIITANLAALIANLLIVVGLLINQ